MPEQQPTLDADVVDQLLEDWGRERPDLDVSAMAVVGRLLHLGALLQAGLASDFDPTGSATPSLTCWRRCGARARLISSAYGP
ncbi:hypothetical protein ACRAWD_02785 [Caulobacter segnis]